MKNKERFKWVFFNISTNLNYVFRIFRREQVVCPEMARLVRQFEGTKEPEEKMHHEQYSKFQLDFKADVSSLVDAFDQLGNPFL